VDLIPVLRQLTCPVAFVVRGRQGSKLLAKDLEDFKRLLKKPFVRLKAASDHSLGSLNLPWRLREVEVL
jgi:hypothetical protein